MGYDKLYTYGSTNGRAFLYICRNTFRGVTGPHQMLMQLTVCSPPLFMRVIALPFKRRLGLYRTGHHSYTHGAFEIIATAIAFGNTGVGVL